MSALPRALPLPRAARLVERNLLVYRSGWAIIVSGFFEPLFYLLGIGFGLGTLLPPITLGGGHRVSYAVFAAPALMASSAMNGAISEASFNLFFKLKYVKLYDGVLATPMGIGDVAAGEAAWALIRGAIYSIGFAVIMAALGLIGSPWGLLAVPAALLVSFAFAAAAMAATTFMRSWQDFDLVQLVILPLFLFSGTFFPVTVYPPPVQLLVELTPLYHAVDLLRGLVTGFLGWPQVADIAYLVAMGAACVSLTTRRLRRLLVG